MLRLIPVVLILTLLVACQGEPTEKTVPESVAVAEPHPALPLIPGDDVVTGQTIYVPAFSSIYTRDDQRTAQLAVTLSVRNVDTQRSIQVRTVNYHATDGTLVRSYIEKPQTIPPLGVLEFVVKEQDISGGSSVSFLVQWTAATTVSAPLVETVMIATSHSQGLSFTERGVVVDQL